MTDSTNQTNFQEDRLAENKTSQTSVLLSDEAQKTWRDFLLFWRHRPALPVARTEILPAVRADILPAKRVSKVPAIFLGVLLGLFFLRADLSYWDLAVNRATVLVSIPTKAINIAYSQITRPLNYTADKMLALIKNAEWTVLALIGDKPIERSEEGAFGGSANVAMIFDESSKKTESCVGQILIQAGEDLIQKMTKMTTVKEKKIGQFFQSIKQSIKERTIARRQLLEARAVAVFAKIKNSSSAYSVSTIFSNFNSNLKRGLARVQDRAELTLSQIATVRELSSPTKTESIEPILSQVDGGWLGDWSGFLSQKISALWTFSWQKIDRAVASWRQFTNPSKISPETLEEIKKTITEEVTKNLQSQINQTDLVVKQASYGAVVVPSTGDPLADEKIKKDLENQFSDEVSISFDKSGQAGIITPIFENGQRGDDYIFMLTPIRQ